MNCYQFRNSISNFIDEDLSFKNRQALKSHLADCPTCQKLYDSMLATRQCMRNFSSVTVSENFNLNLRNRILSDRNAQIQRSMQKGFSLKRIPSFAYGFAAAIVAVAAGFLVLQSQSGDNPQIAPPPIVQQQMAQPLVRQPQRITPANPVQAQPQQRVITAQNQSARPDTITKEDPGHEPSLEYKQNYQDKIKTVKDQQ